MARVRGNVTPRRRLRFIEIGKGIRGGRMRTARTPELSKATRLLGACGGLGARRVPRVVQALTKSRFLPVAAGHLPPLSRSEWARITPFRLLDVADQSIGQYTSKGTPHHTSGRSLGGVERSILIPLYIGT